MVAPKSSTLACTGNAGIPHGGIVRFFAPDISQKAIHAAALRAIFSLYFYGRMSVFPPVRKACCTPAFRGFCWQIIASRSHGMCHLNRCNPLNMRVGLSFFFFFCMVFDGNLNVLLPGRSILQILGIFMTVWFYCKQVLLDSN